MEALVAVGLASNVLQFVDFTAKLIGISNELRNHAASSENRDHQVIATHLETLSQNISNSANAISQISATVSSEEKDLQPVANKCCELAKNLLKRLDTCGIQPGQNASRLQRAKGAFKAIWNKREIEEISSRLEYFRSELILYYAFQTRKTQLELSERQSSKDDIQPVLDKLDDLGPMIESVKRGVYDKYNVQHSELLGSIADAQSENVRLHTQAAHRGIEGQSTVLNRLEGLQASMTTLNVGVQDIRCQQSGTIESLAQARVENSTFLAGITQQVSLASNSSSTLQYALRPLLEEYKEKFIAEVKKEFRGTARSQMNNMFENALPALDEMQSLSTTIPPRYATVVSEAISETDRTDFGSQSSSELQNLDTVKKRSHGKFDKNSFTMIYHKRRWFVSDIGTLSLFIRDCVHFSASGTPTEVYELTAQFIPSPRWLSTGCSIIYKNRIDARGSPELGLRLQSYRVLDDNHEVWRAIGRDNISHIQDMLSQKIISTSDRNVDGRTLLHYAVSLGRLDICKALVQSGADINVHDCNGESIIVNALNPEKLWENGQSKDIIHYLLSLGVELEDFWSDDAPALLCIASSMAVAKLRIPQSTINRGLQDWISICRLIDINLNSVGQLSFLIRVVSFFSLADPDDKISQELSDLEDVFDAIGQLEIGGSTLMDTTDGLVMHTADWLYDKLDQTYELSLMADEASSTLSTPYRGYYVHPTAAKNFSFLEHVISRGITQRPSCIFDHYNRKSVSRKFYYSRWRGIWEGILKDNGFDVDWVYEEEKRRQRVITGETTAHEVSVGIDTSKALGIKRRRQYENSDD